MLKNLKLCLLILAALSLLLIRTNAQSVKIQDNLNYTSIPVTGFKFDVFCPIPRVTKNYQNFYLNRWQQMAHKKLRSNPHRHIDKYVIQMQLRANPSGHKVFHFCSLAKKWNQTDCTNARLICSSPGPMFYIRRGTQIEVAWIHNIQTSPTNLPPTFSSSYRLCIREKPDMIFPGVNIDDVKHCTIPTRKGSKLGSSNKVKLSQQSCTYLDSTSMGSHGSGHDQMEQFDQTHITALNIPVSVHIHGLETRPTFDGNPLSFWTTDGSKGVAYYSLTNEDYYEQFENYIPTSFQLTPEQDSRTKINRYSHHQPAGHIWYHDHSMHATNYNVRAGLAGIYIIYDPAVEALLPVGENELFLTVAEASQIVDDNDIAINESMEHNGFKLNPKDYTFATNMVNLTQTGFTLKRNSTYRFKILNAIFESAFTNLLFATDCNINPASNSSRTIPLDTCAQVLNFSIIGADGAFFDKPIHDVKSVPYLSSAERLEILIVFDGEANGQPINPIRDGVNKVYFLSFDALNFNSTVGFGKSDNFYIRMEFNLEESSKPNIYTAPNSLKSLPVPYYDLSTINRDCLPGFDANPQSSTLCIAAVRHRPLLMDAFVRFFINGHYNFHLGASQNPQIGTTEDWVFVNTMVVNPIPHPMHMHLVNFQVIEEWTLKMAFDPVKYPQVACTYYELDFYDNVGLFQSKNQNITKALISNYDKCLFLKTQFDITKETEIYNHYLENKPNPGTTNVYGLDTFSRMGIRDAQKYNDTTCIDPMSPYKYVCAKIPQFAWPAWYKKWKDTALVLGGNAVRYRIRFASPEYDPTVQAYPYFSVPQDQLIEFPGFVYHCHFITHEDDQMMRSFMMLPSTHYKRLHKDDDNQFADCLQQQGTPKSEWDTWAAKYTCINKATKCGK